MPAHARAVATGAPSKGGPHDRRAAGVGGRLRLVRADDLVVEAAAVSRPAVSLFKRKYAERLCRKCGQSFRPAVYNQMDCGKCVDDKRAKRIEGMRS